VAKHAQASEVVVELAIVDGMAVATVSDNGVGLQPGRQREAALDGHLGLLTVRERLAQVGGSLEVRGARPHGTTVRLAVPAPSFAPAGVAS
jgi:two-component system NarL family sensor kinase